MKIENKFVTRLTHAEIVALINRAAKQRSLWGDTACKVLRPERVIKVKWDAKCERYNYDFVLVNVVIGACNKESCSPPNTQAMAAICVRSGTSYYYEIDDIGMQRFEAGGRYSCHHDKTLVEFLLERFGKEYEVFLVECCGREYEKELQEGYSAY